MLGSALIVVAAAVAAPEESEPIQWGRYELAYPYPSPLGGETVIQGNFDGRWQLYVVDADGALRRLTVSQADDTQPAWSPDGGSIAFVSTRSGNPDIHLLDIASGDVRVVGPHPGKDGHPKWSPDGEWIVFNRTFDPADVDGDSDSAILRVRPDGSGLETLSDTPNIETFASFSPTGNAIVFVEWLPDAEGRPGRNGELVVMDLATGTRRNITNSPEFDGYPHWGPGGWIYFSSTANAPPTPEMTVYRITPDGVRKEAITPIDGHSEVRAVPSTDERTLYYNVSEGGRTILMRRPLMPSD